MSTAVAALPVLGAAKAAQGDMAPASKDFFVDWTRNQLVLPRIGLKESVRLRVIGDTHFNFYDERDAHEEPAQGRHRTSRELQRPACL